MTKYDRMTFNTVMTVAALTTIAANLKVDLRWETRTLPTARVMVDDERFGIWAADTGAYLGRCIVWG